MEYVEDAIRAHEERCNSSIGQRLVSWKWLVTISAGSIITLIVVAWSFSARAATVEEKLLGHDRRIIRIEGIYEDIKWIRSKLEEK